MSIKVVFFDFDGVLTIDSSGSKTTNTFLSKYYGTPIEEIKQFIGKFNDRLLLGEIEHKDIWNQVCSHFGWVEDISVLKHAFESTLLDTEMIHIANSIRSKNIRTGIITDNKMDRMEAINRKYAIDSIFNPIIVSSAIHHTKMEIETFQIAKSLVGSEYHEMIFIDNTEENLVAPARLGVHTYYYNHKAKDVGKLEKYLGSLLRIEDFR